MDLKVTPFNVFWTINGAVTHIPDRKENYFDIAKKPNQSMQLDHAMYIVEGHTAKQNPIIFALALCATV